MGNTPNATLCRFEAVCAGCLKGALGIGLNEALSAPTMTRAFARLSPASSSPRAAVRLEPGLVERAHPHRANSRANDVVPGEFDHRHGQHLRLDHMDDGAQTAGLLEVALVDVAVDHHDAVFADPGQKDLHLGRACG